jgi:hypothetical protein
MGNEIKCDKRKFGFVAVSINELIRQVICGPLLTDINLLSVKGLIGLEMVLNTFLLCSFFPDGKAKNTFKFGVLHVLITIFLFFSLVLGHLPLQEIFSQAPIVK